MAKKAATSRTAAAVTPEIIDVQERPDVALVKTEAAPIATFVNNMAVFFSQAQSLEERAAQDLVSAQAWQEPTSREEDEDLIARIRQNAAETKLLEQHWDVTTVLSRMHRSLTAMRNRATAIRDQVKTRGNALHGAYERREQERVRKEAEEKRLAEERRLREQRQREQEEAERLALEAEANAPTLSDRETRFVEAYVCGLGVAGNAQAAAARVGYRDADKAAVKLLATEKVRAAIEAKRAAVAIREQAEAKRHAPIVAVAAETAAPQSQVAKASRVYYSCEVVDEAAFMAVVLDPTLRMRYNVPASVATYQQPVLNDIARAVKDEINKIPGLRLKTTTSV